MSGAITGTTLAMVGLGAAGSIGGAAIASHAAGKAADAQASAANNSAQLQYQASQNALDFQKQQYNQNQQNLAPWLQGGREGLSQLEYLMGLGGSPSSAQQGGMPGAPTAPTAGTGGRAPIGMTPRAMGAGSGAVLSSADPRAVANGFGQAQGVSGPMGNAAPGMASAAGIMPSATGNPMPNPGGPALGPGASNPMQPPSAGATSANPNLGGFGSLLQGYGQQFEAPTGLTMQNDPGYQARLQLGTDAIQRSAAARGGLVTGGTAKALDTYGQDYASNEYGNVYNRALDTYGTNYNQWSQQQTNTYNRLASLAGLGQQTAGQLGMLGQNALNNVSQNLLSTAQNMGNDYQNAGAATASGYVGAANAWNGALSGTGNNLQNLLMLNQLQGGGGSSSSAYDNGGY